MTEHVQTWLDERASTADDWRLPDLLARKDQSVAVVLPALNEAATVGQIVQTIRDELLGTLVDELVVLDSGSTDDTAAVAAAHGARVVALDSVFPGLPSLRGKGEAMWRALAATDADLVVFIDADLRSFTARYVTGLLGPLLTDPDVHLVKAVYERPLVDRDSVVAAGGGRVTELVARPLLNLYWPELAGVIQPLAGVRRPPHTAGAAAVSGRLRGGVRDARGHRRTVGGRCDRPGRSRGADPPSPR